jgi:hypothetical protein
VRYGGPGPEIGTTLSVLLAGDPEPQALPLRRTMLADGGAGRYVMPYNATTFMHRALKHMGLVSA